MGIALRFLTLLIFAVPLSAQTMTITGHLAPFNAKIVSCECVPGTQGTVKLELHRYFTNVIDGAFRREATYPVGVAPPGRGVDPLEFASNEVTVTIGNDVWRSQYAYPRPAQALNLVAWDKRYGVFQSLDGKVFMFRDSPDRPDGRPRIALLNLDLRTSNDLALWNVTGAAIPSGKPTGFSQFGMLFYGKQERVVFTVDNVGASPVEVAETTTTSHGAAPSPAQGSKNGYYAPQPPPVLPGGGSAPPAAGGAAGVPIHSAPVKCVASMARNTRIMSELIAIEDENLLVAAMEVADREAVLTAMFANVAVQCVTEAYVNAMASKKGVMGGNQLENKQASDARKEAERKTGKQFSPQLQRKFHDEITGHRYSYDELVEIAIDVLNGRT